MIHHQSANSVGNYHYDPMLYQDQVFMPHFHKNLEWIYVLNGTLNVTVNDREQPMHPGDSALVLSNQIHALEPVGEVQYFVAVFSEDHVPVFTKEIRTKQGETFRFRCSEAVDALLRTYLIEGECSLCMRKACLYALCDQFLQSVPLEKRTEKSDFLVGRVLDYIAEHYTENITLKQCAEHLNYDYHYLSSMLKNNYKISFRKTLNGYRLDTAIAMLDRGDRSLTEIAFASGFQSVRSFNDVFRRQIGKTPGEVKAGRGMPLKDMPDDE